MSQPTVIGDVIQLAVTYTPPSHAPLAKVTAAEMITRSPSGIETIVDGTEESTNVWLFVAPTRIHEHGVWTVRINANAGLIDSLEIPLHIARSNYVDPILDGITSN